MQLNAIKADLKCLTNEELVHLRDFVEDLLEDQQSFTSEFEAQIQQSEQEMSKGIISRTKNLAS